MDRHTPAAVRRSRAGAGDAVMRIFSSGGGRQSTAVLVLAAQGIVKYDAFVFANVGNDSENPATIDYLHNYTLPFAEEHGIRFEVVQKTRYRKPDTVRNVIFRKNRSIPLPMYLPLGGRGNRACTYDFKVGTVDKWCKQNDATDVVVGLGISTNEPQRIRSTEWKESKFYKGMMKKREYPLIDLHMNNAQCAKLVADAGLPPAPRSSCWFCPFHRHSEWILMRENNPTLFEKAVEVDEHLRIKRGTLMEEATFLHPSRKPLSVVVGEQANFLDEFDNCESGYCFT